MKKIFSRSFIALILSFTLLFNPFGSLKKAYAAEVVGIVSSAVGIVSFAISVIRDASSSSSELAQQRNALRSSWVNLPAANSEYWIYVSGDDLTRACMDLVGSGVPCQVVYNSSLQRYFIQCTANPINPYDGLLLDSSYTYRNKYFGYCSDHYDTAHSSLHTYIFYSTNLDSSNLLGSIKSEISSIHTTLFNMLTPIEQTASRLNTLLGYVDGIEGYIDGIENFLSVHSSNLTSINNSVSDIESHLISLDGNTSALVDLVSTKQYMSGYTSNSSGTVFSTVTLPYDVATSYCAYLNANFVGKSLNMFNRDDLNVASTQIFNYATISSNYIRINYGSNSMGYLASRRKTLYKVASPNSINVSGDINATLDDTNIVNALNDIEDTLSSLNISASDLMTQYYCVNTTFSDSSSYPSVYIPYESAVNLVALLNAEMQGHNISRLDRDSDTIVSSFRFNVARMSNGYIVVIPGSSTSGGFYLCSKNHILIRYSEPTYSSVLGNIDSSLSTISDALYSTVPQVESSVRGGVRDVTALVPVADTAMSILDSTSLVLADFSTLIAPEVGILALAGDILDAIVDGSGNSAITQRLDQIKNKIDSTNDKLDDVNENLENILSWLDDSDLADYSTIRIIVQNWSDDVISSVVNSTNILSLFESAYGDSANLYSYSDWQTAKDYFTNFWGN